MAGCIARDVVEHFGFKHHEAGIDGGVVVFVFLTERLHGIVAADVEDTLHLYLVYRRERGCFAMRTVVGYQLVDIHVAQTVAVGQHKSLVANVFTNALDSPSGHGVETGIDHGHFPRFHTGMMHHQIITFLGKVESDIRAVEEIMGEPFLDVFLPVSGTDDELVMPIMGIQFHDVPEDWHAQYLYHGFGFESCFFF